MAANALLLSRNSAPRGQLRVVEESHEMRESQSINPTWLVANVDLLRYLDSEEDISVISEESGEDVGARHVCTYYLKWSR
jgi:hypothetical protein